MSHVVMPDPFEPLGTGFWYDLGVGTPPFSAEGVLRPEYVAALARPPLSTCITCPFLIPEETP